MSRSLERNLLIWLLCALVPIGLIGYVTHQQTSKVVSSNELVIHTHEVKEEMDAIVSLLNTAETSVRGFVITGKEEFLDPYLTASPQIEDHLKLLAALVKENPDQMKRLRDVQPLIVERLDRLGNIVIVRKQKGLDAAADIVSTGAGQHLMAKIRQQMHEMQGEEGKLLETRSKQSKSVTMNALNVTTILTVFALILVGCNVFFARLRL